VNILRLSTYLKGYPPNLHNYITSGFRNGFRLGAYFQNTKSGGDVPNLLSARRNPQVITAKIHKEVDLGRIKGPFPSPVSPQGIQLHLSPLGVVPKKAGGHRVIHHLSYPSGQSVNDSIPREYSSVTYSSIHQAIAWIKQAGPGVYLAKTDVESAFRIIPVHKSDQPLLGFSWEGMYYMDAVLPMGASSSCAIFDTFSSCLEWVAINKLGVTSMLHVLDDFLIMAVGEDRCRRDLDVFIKFCSEVGVPIAAEKTFGPFTELQFVGITLDTVKLEARLPQDKIDKCTSLIESFLPRSKVTLRELQSLIGVLNFACLVVLPGRPFLRRLIDLTIGMSHPRHHIRLTKQTKQDLRTWAQFLLNFNGRSFFIEDEITSSNALKLYTDSAGSLGFGAIYDNKWFGGTWPALWRHYNIATLELYPIVAALAVWGKEWENKTVCFYTDNQAIVSVINKQSAKDPHIMSLLRRLVLLCLDHNIVFSAKHIPGHHNIYADLISRLQVSQFLELCPNADRSPVQVPAGWLPAGLGTL